MGSRLIVAAPYAEFSKTGPAQDMTLDVAQHRFENYLLEQHTGPDFQLPKGSTVTMLKREEGYSKVVITDNGVAGQCVQRPTETGPASRPCRALGSTQPDQNFRQRTKATPSSRKNQEQLDLSDIPLPLPS